MSNTLKFGNGEWAVKKGSTLAYNSENGNFKPLPFTFDRSTSATRVNKQGLIEVVPNNEPRIDFLNDSKGALLLEPSRSNIIPYSEDLTKWNVILGGVFSVTSNTTDFVSPSGKFDASKVEFTNSNQAIGQALTLSGDYSGYVYVKGTQGETIRFNFGGSEQNFTLTGEWDKLERTNVTSTAGAFNLNTFGGVTSRTIYVWGAQLEQGSYATSTIPTQGSIGTRVAESCSQTVPDGIIGQTEGVIFLDVKMPSAIQSSTTFSIGGGTNGEYAQLEIRSDLSINWRYRQGSTDYINANVGSYIAGDRLKLAFAYKSGSSILYKNGASIATNNGSIGSNSWNNVYFANFAGTGNLNADVNQLSLYNTRLTNAELQALTTI